MGQGGQRNFPLGAIKGGHPGKRRKTFEGPVKCSSYRPQNNHPKTNGRKALGRRGGGSPLSWVTGGETSHPCFKVACRYGGGKILLMNGNLEGRVGRTVFLIGGDCTGRRNDFLQKK